MANLSMDLMADWIKFFQNRINIERQRKRLSAPLHAELNDSITVVISELCRRFQLPLEVYPTALEFYEDLLFLEEEEQRSGKLPGDHYFNPAPKQDQLENRMQREMLACIQLASKTVCNRRVLTTRMLNSLFPGISYEMRRRRTRIAFLFI